MTTKSLIDTGASVSCVAQSFLRSLGSHLKIQPCLATKALGVGGEAHSILGTIQLEIKIQNVTFSHVFYVLPKVHHHIIIGDDFLTSHAAQIDRGDKTICFPLNSITVNFCPPTARKGVICPAGQYSIPARTEVLLPVKISRCKTTQLMLLEPCFISKKTPLLGARSVNEVLHSMACCRILNPTDHPVTLYPNQPLGVAHTLLADDITISSIVTDTGDPLPPTSPNPTTSPTSPVSTKDAASILEELGIDLSDSPLTAEQKQSLTTLIASYRDVFALNFSEMGETDLVTHTIDTRDAQPVRQRFYRTSPAVRKEIDRQVEDMLQNDIIEPSTSNWTSPVCMVRKHDSTMRFAIDFRAINILSVPQFHPLPTLDTVFDFIGEKQPAWFSSIDLFSCYFQIKMDPASKPKTAFTTQSGCWQFKRMPFGLSGAPASAMKLMNMVLKGLQWDILLAYLDDILVMSLSFSKHLEHLALVFDRLRAAHLTLKPSKSSFAKKKLLYLGHVLTPEGVSVNPQKVAAVASFPTPKTAKQVRSFLGLCSFYRIFIKGFANIAHPLHQLLKKDEKFNWSSACETAFQELKSALITPPVLQFPDMNKEFTLTTDASGTAIGYILSQKDKLGHEHPIHFGGRSLRPPETRYTITELELLAFVEAIKNNHVYLINKPFQVVSDHAALKWLHNLKPHTGSGRLARWALLLQEYQFTLTHKPGSKLPHADCLSRRQYSPPTNSETFPETSEKVIVHLELADHSATIPTPDVPTVEPINLSTPDITLPSLNSLATTDLVQAQKTCPDFQHIYAYLSSGTLPDNQKEATKIVAESDQYIIDNDVLYHIYTPRTRKVPAQTRCIRQLALPTNLRHEALVAYHDSLLGGGHVGFEKTYMSILGKFFWKRMYREILEYVKSCDTCQKIKRHPHFKPAPLTSLPITQPFDRLHVDILGPLHQAADKSQYLLICVDAFTKWPLAFPLQTQDSKSIVDTLYKEVFTVYGFPRTIVSDRGAPFLSKLVASVCEFCKISRIHTSSYHPQTNSSAEVYCGNIARSLRAYSDKNQTNWPEMVPGILMAYRHTPGAGTQYSPYYLLFGREMTLPFDTSVLPKPTLPSTVQTYLNQLIDTLKVSQAVATENQKEAQAKNKKYYDKKAAEPSFKAGDKVLLQNPRIPVGLSKKLVPKFEGPYYIRACGPNYTYYLKRLADHKDHPSPVNANRLKPYLAPESRTLQPPQPVVTPQPVQTNQGPSWHPVDKLLATKVISNVRHYRVKWQSNDPPTWLPAKDISPNLIVEYHSKFTKTGRRRKRLPYRYFKQPKV